MLKPTDFLVNEAWLVVKPNNDPILLAEGSFNLFVLMDAASGYIIDQLIVPSEQKQASIEVVESILLKAFQVSHGGPKKIIISHDWSEKNTFKIAAVKLGILTMYEPAANLIPITKEFFDHHKARFPPGLGG